MGTCISSKGEMFMNARILLVVTIAIVLSGCSKQEVVISDWQEKEYTNYFEENESTENYVRDYIEDESKKWNSDYKADDTKIIGL